MTDRCEPLKERDNIESSSNAETSSVSGKHQYGSGNQPMSAALPEAKASAVLYLSAPRNRRAVAWSPANASQGVKLAVGNEVCRGGHQPI